MDNELETKFVEAWDQVAELVEHNALNKGFWGKSDNIGEKIALIHSELSEALEAIRKNNPIDDKCPEFTSFSVELADAVIRIMDLSYHYGYDISNAIVAKIRYNTTRPPMHGKTF